MLTTETPAAQLFSIASSGARPSEARAVADRRRHRDDRGGDQACDHTRQGAFHPATTTRRWPRSGRQMVEKAVDAGNADVRDQVGVAARHARGEWQLPAPPAGRTCRRRRRSTPGSSGCGLRSTMATRASSWYSASGTAAWRARKPSRSRRVTSNRPDCSTRRAPIAATWSGVLPRPRIDFRQAIAQVAMVVDLGEIEVFVGQVTQLRQRLLDVDGAVRDCSRRSLSFSLTLSASEISGRIIASPTGGISSVLHSFRFGGEVRAAVRRSTSAVDKE